MAPRPPSPPPTPSVSSTGGTQKDCGRVTTCLWETGGRSGREAESYDRKKVWSSVNHSILSEFTNTKNVYGIEEKIKQNLASCQMYVGQEYRILYIEFVGANIS